MKETCNTCSKWDDSLCPKDIPDRDGFCEIDGKMISSNHSCEKHKIKISIKIKRWYYKFKSSMNKYPDPLKFCEKAKSGKCVHIDGFLCPCDEMKKDDNGGSIL